MATYGQILNGQIYLGASVGWQPVPTGTVGNPSTVRVSTAPVVQGNVIMPSPSSLVAPTGSYAPLVVQPTPAPAVTGISASTAPVVQGNTVMPQTLQQHMLSVQQSQGGSFLGIPWGNMLTSPLSASGQPLFSGFPSSTPAVITPTGTAPNVSGLFAPPPLTDTSTLTPQTQISQLVSPSGRSMGRDAYSPAISSGVTKHLDYL